MPCSSWNEAVLHLSSSNLSPILGWGKARVSLKPPHTSELPKGASGGRGRERGSQETPPVLVPSSCGSFSSMSPWAVPGESGPCEVWALSAAARRLLLLGAVSCLRMRDSTFRRQGASGLRLCWLMLLSQNPHEVRPSLHTRKEGTEAQRGKLTCFIHMKAPQFLKSMALKYS